jgi:hypothetical protein
MPWPGWPTTSQCPKPSRVPSGWSVPPAIAAWVGRAGRAYGVDARNVSGVDRGGQEFEASLPGRACGSSAPRNDGSGDGASGLCDDEDDGREAFPSSGGAEVEGDEPLGSEGEQVL